MKRHLLGLGLLLAITSAWAEFNDFSTKPKPTPTPSPSPTSKPVEAKDLKFLHSLKFIRFLSPSGSEGFELFCLETAKKCELHSLANDESTGNVEVTRKKATSWIKAFSERLPPGEVAATEPKDFSSPFPKDIVVAWALVSPGAYSRGSVSPPSGDAFDPRAMHKMQALNFLESTLRQALSAKPAKE